MLLYFYLSSVYLNRIDIGAATSQRRMPFESASSGSGQFSKVMIRSTGSVNGTVGDVVDWSTARSEVRNYSLNIIMAQSKET